MRFVGPVVFNVEQKQVAAGSQRKFQGMDEGPLTGLREVGRMQDAQG